MRLLIELSHTLAFTRDDAEVEVIEEPKAGMFGRVRGEARVRARVRPSGPRPKRSRRSSGGRERWPRNAARIEKSRTPKAVEAEGNRKEKDKTVGAPRQNQGSPKRGPRTERVSTKEGTMAEGISLAEQGSIAKEFLEGLLASINIQAEVSVKELDTETVELAVNANPPTELGIWLAREVLRFRRFRR